MRVRCQEAVLFANYKLPSSQDYPVVGCSQYMHQLMTSFQCGTRLDWQTQVIKNCHQSGCRKFEIWVRIWHRKTVLREY